MKPYQDDERRIHPRVERSLELEGSTDSGGTPARLLASNLSLGGVHCTSETDFPEMTRLAVRFALPGRRASVSLDLPAVVVRRRRIEEGQGAARFELALLFTTLTAVQRERLSRFLAR